MNLDINRIVQEVRGSLKLRHDMNLSDAATLELHDSIARVIMMHISEAWSNCKQERGEMVGLVMYYCDTDVGITLLAENTASIMIMLNINRRTLGEDFYEITDIGWYTSNLVHKLIRNGCPVDLFQYEEIESC